MTERAKAAQEAFIQAAEPGISVMGWLCLVCVVVASAILLHHLVRRPQLLLPTKLRLALGLGLFPAMAAVTNSADSLHTTTERRFCGDCHVMTMHTQDSEDPNSTSLAARHARNPYFGTRNCYVCHADYGYLGYPLTKLNGMKHVWSYYTDGFVNEDVKQAIKRIHLYKPYNNQNCMQCHSGTGTVWKQVPEHVSLWEDLAKNKVSCASEGCHGYAHPFSKPGAKTHGTQASNPQLSGEASGLAYLFDQPLSSDVGTTNEHNVRSQVSGMQAQGMGVESGQLTRSSTR